MKDERGGKTYARIIKKRETTYESMRQTAKKTKESRTQIARNCKDSKNPDYGYVDIIKYVPQHVRRSIRCKVDGIEYPILTKAAKALKIPFDTIKKRCNSKDYPNYELL